MNVINWILGIFNFWRFPINVYGEINQWIVLKNALKEDDVKRLLKECDLPKPSELRSDDLGRLYTVINVPEDIYETKHAVWPYVMEMMKKIDGVLFEARLSDLVYPDIKQIEGTRSYKLVLHPKNDYLNIRKFIGEGIRWVFLWYFVVFIIKILSHFNVNVLEYLNQFFDFVITNLPF